MNFAKTSTVKDVNTSIMGVHALYTENWHSS